jgi:hypothetical protein
MGYELPGRFEVDQARNNRNSGMRESKLLMVGLLSKQQIFYSLMGSQPFRFSSPEGEGFPRSPMGERLGGEVNHPPFFVLHIRDFGICVFRLAGHTPKR